MRADAATRVLYLPPVLLNVFLAWLFGHTPVHGSVPLVERLVLLLQRPGEPPEAAIARHARRLTITWTALFVLPATLHLGLALCVTPGGLLEYAYRRRRFPGWPLRNLLEFLRRAAATGPPLMATFAPLHFVRRVEVSYEGEPMMVADVDLSISENPNFRFYFMPPNGGQLQAKVVDNHDLKFDTAPKPDAGRVTAAPALR